MFGRQRKLDQKRILERLDGLTTELQQARHAGQHLSDEHGEERERLRVTLREIEVQVRKAREEAVAASARQTGELKGYIEINMGHLLELARITQSLGLAVSKLVDLADERPTALARAVAREQARAAQVGPAK